MNRPLQVPSFDNFQLMIARQPVSTASLCAADLARELSRHSMHLEDLFVADKIDEIAAAEALGDCLESCAKITTKLGVQMSGVVLSQLLKARHRLPA